MIVGLLTFFDILPNIPVSRSLEKLIRKNKIAFKIPTFITRERAFMFLERINSMKFSTKLKAIKNTSSSFRIMKGRLVFEVKKSFKMKRKSVTPMNNWIFIFFFKFMLFKFIFGAKLHDFLILVKTCLSAGLYDK
jgi:hypothetical protein